MKQRTHCTLLMAVIMVTAFLCIGWTDEWTSMKAAAGKVTSVTAEFTQEKHMRILSHPLVSKGVFYYQTPESLRWEYQSPVRSIVLMHNGNTRRYIQQKEGLIEDSGADLQSLQIVLQEIVQWLGGRFDENSSFAAVFEQQGQKIVLTPRQKSISMLIHRIELVPSAQAGLMESVTIYESKDSFTRLTFQKATLNQKIAEPLFREK
jgi:outer membrane lipoprotein-sorting protein